MGCFDIVHVGDFAIGQVSNSTLVGDVSLEQVTRNVLYIAKRFRPVLSLPDNLAAGPSPRRQVPPC